MSSTLAKLKEKINIKEAIVMVVLALLLFFLVKMMFGGIFGTSLVVIENGPCPQSSMCPVYDQGDMFLIYKSAPENIELGDVIVYESENGFSTGILIIHRVVNITIIDAGAGDQYFFRVSGDNKDSNQAIDDFNSTTSLIPYENIVGKTVLLIPKIGYLRLWLSDSPVFRYLLIGLLVAAAIYLIFVPDKKKEDETKDGESGGEKSKEIVEETSEKDEEKPETKKPFLVVFKESIIRWWEKTKKNFIEIFTVKKKRTKLIIYTSIIIAIIIAIPILDAIITSPGVETGINDVDPKGLRYNLLDEGIIYLPMTIHFNHDGSYDAILKSFDIYGIQAGEVIGHMRWYSFYQKEGALQIGSTLVFN
ncbi:MAG: signal peptidase I, partial [Candidatus Heimdallarchaeota archaeon]|nr:signal peptidase I [Candidatus Heimdallarchaeota archaeon]